MVCRLQHGHRCPTCGALGARTGYEAMNGLNDIYAGDPYPYTACLGAYPKHPLVPETHEAKERARAHELRVDADYHAMHGTTDMAAKKTIALVQASADHTRMANWIKALKARFA